MCNKGRNRNRSSVYRPLLPQRLGILLLTLLAALIGLASCNRPSDIFLPIIVGEATAAPTILDTPNATPTALATRTPLPVTPPTRTSTPATRTTADSTMVSTPSRTAVANTPSGQRVIALTGTTTAQGGEVAATLDVETPTPQIPTATPTLLFRSYIAQILSQLQPTPTATLLGVPLVLTPTPRPTATPTITPTGLPTNTPTPFSGAVRLLDRDPVFETDLVMAVAYAVPDSRIAKNWSDFYGIQSQNSELVRIYASETAKSYDPVLALTSTEEWAEGVCMVGSTMIGVQFWGDENDGWARVLVDGSERWRGNTYGHYPNLFVHFLEIRDLKKAPHVIRIEPLGRAGTTAAGGNSHVSIYAIVCGMPAETEIFVPILQR